MTTPSENAEQLHLQKDPDAASSLNYFYVELFSESTFKESVIFPIQKPLLAQATGTQKETWTTSAALPPGGPHSDPTPNRARLCGPFPLPRGPEKRGPFGSAAQTLIWGPSGRCLL